MNTSNKFNLPNWYVRALDKKPYSKGGSDFSITELISPPRISALIKRHEESLTEDVSNRIVTSLGEGWHLLMERGAREIDICEQRFFAKFGEVTLSGQIDAFDGETKELIDWKTTKATAFLKKYGGGKKSQYVQQLNMQLELLRRNGLDANRLLIVGILKDWDASGEYLAELPCGMKCVEIPMWSRERTVSFIEERIKLHQEAKSKLPNCLPSEVWNGKRCKYFCLPAEYCEQYKEAKKTGVF